MKVWLHASEPIHISLWQLQVFPTVYSVCIRTLWSWYLNMSIHKTLFTNNNTIIGFDQILTIYIKPRYKDIIMWHKQSIELSQRTMDTRQQLMTKNLLYGPWRQTITYIHEHKGTWTPCLTVNNYGKYLVIGKATMSIEGVESNGECAIHKSLNEDHAQGDTRTIRSQSWSRS